MHVRCRARELHRLTFMTKTCHVRKLHRVSGWTISAFSKLEAERHRVSTWAEGQLNDRNSRRQIHQILVPILTPRRSAATRVLMRAKGTSTACRHARAYVYIYMHHCGCATEIYDTSDVHLQVYVAEHVHNRARRLRIWEKAVARNGGSLQASQSECL